eukprot:g8611.t1
MATATPEATPTPFPWPPMLAIAIGLVSHSYSLSSLFPYVGYMVQQLGVAEDKDEAGYYAGYLASAFMIGRFAFSYFWGRFADRYGRLPVLYIGLCSIATFSIGFGMSTTFWWAVTCRFLLGAMNGLIAVGKCLISEVCGKEHETVGMSFVTACWSIGMVFGPALGGLLSETTDKGLFGRFPYLLPNLVGASLAISGLPMVFFFVKETIDLDDGRDNGGSSARFKPLATSEPDESDRREAGMEEGRGKMLEMTPLTQANSLDNDGNDDEENLAELLGGSMEESNPASATMLGGNDGGDKGIISATNAWEGTTSNATKSLGDSGASMLETSGKDDAGQGRNHSRFQPSPAPSGSSLPSRTGRGALVLDSEAQRGTNKASDSRRESGGGSKTKTNLDGGVLESFDGEDQTTRNAVWRECLVPITLLQDTRVRAILIVYGVYSFASIGYGEIYPLWALSTVASGGLDWTTKQIGQVLSLCGFGMLVFQLLVYPSLSKRMGVTTTQRLACLLSIPVYLAFPLLSRLRDSGAVLVVASIAFNFLSNVTATALFINIALATNNSVDPSRRATVNGLSMMLGSLAKAAGPAVFSAIFAWSIDGDARPFPLDYHLVFYLLALSMVFVSCASWNVITGDPPPRTQATEAEPAPAPPGANAEG